MRRRDAPARHTDGALRETQTGLTNCCHEPAHVARCPHKQGQRPKGFRPGCRVTAMGTISHTWNTEGRGETQAWRGGKTERRRITGRITSGCDGSPRLVCGCLANRPWRAPCGAPPPPPPYRTPSLRARGAPPRASPSAADARPLPWPGGMNLRARETGSRSAAATRCVLTRPPRTRVQRAGSVSGVSSRTASGKCLGSVCYPLRPHPLRFLAPHPFLDGERVQPRHLAASALRVGGKAGSGGSE